MTRVFATIRWRLVLSFAVISIVAIAVMGGLSMAVIGRLVERRERDMLQETAAVIATQSLPYFSPILDQRRLQHLAETSALMGDVRVWILDRSRRVWADSARMSDYELVWAFPAFGDLDLGSAAVLLLMERSRLSALEQWREEMYRRFGLESHARGMRVRRDLLGNRLTLDRQAASARAALAEPEAEIEPAVTVPIGDPARPFGYVQIGSGRGVLQEVRRGLRDTFVAAGVATTVLAALIGLVVGRRMTAPISSLTSSARRMGDGDLGVRAPERGKGEMRELAVAFNAMASRLGTTIEELRRERDVLRRFVGDASHELRTPLTALRTFTELMKKHPEDEQMRGEFLPECLRQIERMEWITTNVLDIARLEGGVAGLERRPLQLTDAARNAIALLRARAESRSVQVELIERGRTAVEGDQRSLEAAIGNLVQNAIDWTALGTTVTVDIHESDDTVHLSVTDRGPGISEEDRAHIFERFYRSEHAPEGGSGLGLAIVRAHVEAHGGTVRAENHDSGARFIIELPRAGSDDAGGSEDR